MKTIKLIMPAVACTLISLSCKKKNLEPECKAIPEEVLEDPLTSSSFNFPFKVGTYWIYDHHMIDIDGEITELGIRDSVIIIGDSIVGGETYAVMDYQFLSSIRRIRLLRDNGKAIVDEEGVELIHYASDYKLMDKRDVLWTGVDTVGLTTYHEKKDEGIYAAIQEYESQVGDVLNDCDETKYRQINLWENAKGEVRREYVFIAEYQEGCLRRERVLSEFHPAE